jgi:hypothetical protein
MPLIQQGNADRVTKWLGKTAIRHAVFEFQQLKLQVNPPVTSSFRAVDGQSGRNPNYCRGINTAKRACVYQLNSKVRLSHSPELLPVVEKLAGGPAFPSAQPANKSNATGQRDKAPDRRRSK